MACSAKKRGSVLLLVVALLTMIAMLGGAFLVVARLDAKQSEALVAKQQADPIAQGTVSRLMAVLLDDVDIKSASTAGPYSGHTGWGKFAMYSSDSLSRYLYYHEGTTKHWSNFEGTSADEVDTDGDGQNDAYLIYADVVNPRGEKYFVAVKVVDLAGLMSVNTAYGPPTLTTTARSVVNIDAKAALAGYFTAVHDGRANGAAVTPEQWLDQVARRLLMMPPPQYGYRPYAISDEMYLRWRRSGAMTESGRLYDKIGGMSANVRRILTTFNCSRLLVRYPNAAESFRIPVALSQVTQDSSTLRDRLVKELSSATSDASFGGGGPPPVTFDAKFDFGTGPVQSGYAQVTQTTAYGVHGSLTYGWDPSGTRDSRDRALGDYVQRDFVFTSDSTFRVNVPVAGEYAVTVSMGDMTSSHDQMQVWLEGNLVGTVNNAAGTVITNSYSAQVNDGELTLRLKDAGGSDPNAVINGLTVTLSGAQAGEAEPLPSSAEAAYFVANLWASLTPYETAMTKSFAVSYTQGANARNVCGVTSQPFIVEAFAMHQPSSKDTSAEPPVGKDDFYWGAAIRLLNPTQNPIHLGNYLIAGLTPPEGSTETEKRLPAGDIPAYGSVVLYDYGKGSKLQGDPLAADKLNFKQGGTWVQVTGLRFLSTTTVRIYRVAGTDEIPVDSVSSGSGEGADRADLAYNYTRDNIEKDFEATPTAKKADIRRDDDRARGRYSVAWYYEPTDKNHRLNTGGGVGTTEITLDQVKQGYNLDVDHIATWAKSAGDLAKLFVLGPTIRVKAAGGAVTDAGEDLPHALLRYVKAANANTTDDITQDARARLDYRGKVNPTATRYPKVPWGTLAAELLKFAPGDPDRTDDPYRASSPVNLDGTRDGSRAYGMININTAPPAVLNYLPWPAANDTTLQIGGTAIPISVDAIVAEIISYRDKTGAYAGGRATATGITNLRSGCDEGGYLAPGELAIPLARYMDQKIQALANPDQLKAHPDYLQARNALYRAVSNVITVNSDVFAANIRVQLGNPAKYAWHYVAVIDRSNCFTNDTAPAVLLFSQAR